MLGSTRYVFLELGIHASHGGNYQNTPGYFGSGGFILEPPSRGRAASPATPSQLTAKLDPRQWA